MYSKVFLSNRSTVNETTFVSENKMAANGEIETSMLHVWIKTSKALHNKVDNLHNLEKFVPTNTPFMWTKGFNLSRKLLSFHNNSSPSYFSTNV